MHSAEQVEGRWNGGAGWGTHELYSFSISDASPPSICTSWLTTTRPSSNATLSCANDVTWHMTGAPTVRLSTRCTAPSARKAASRREMCSSGCCLVTSSRPGPAAAVSGQLDAARRMWHSSHAERQKLAAARRGGTHSPAKSESKTEMKERRHFATGEHLLPSGARWHSQTPLC